MALNRLYNTPMDSLHASMEVRFQIEHGDYLAYTPSSVKGDGMQILLRKRQQLDWQAVAALVDEEEKAEKGWRERRSGPFTTVEV